MGGEAHRYLLRRDGMQSISTEGGVGRQSVITQEGVRERERERLLLRREEWEVVAMVNATG